MATPYTCADLWPRCVQGGRSHVDEGLAPDQMRIANPNMAEAQLLAELRKLDHLWQGFGWKQSGAEGERAQLSSPFHDRYSIRRRRLLAPAGNFDLAVDHHD